MKRAITGVFAALALLTGLGSDLDETRLKTGGIPDPLVLLPEGEAVSEFVLLSDSDGWTQADSRMAESLSDEGAIVIGIDQPQWLAALQSEAQDCAYLVAPIESLSKQIQRRFGDGTYRAPIIAGHGAGGALALAIAAQTPDATVERTIAVDPEAFVRLDKQLCTPADKKRVAGGMRYGLPESGLANPVDISLTEKAQGDVPLAGLAPLPLLTVTHVSGDEQAVLASALSARIKDARTAANGLPVAVLDATGDRRALAIIISGDGGWRDIDQKIAAYLQDDGIPSVGLDALRYFWKERTANETAAALQGIIDTHATRNGSTDILLIGYSFGANVMPATYLAMDEAHRNKVKLVSLLSIEKKADFQVSVLGWAGKPPEGRGGDPIADARNIPSGILQCIYGEEDTESGCPGLDGTGAEIVRLTGGHHFDGDYRALTTRIVAAYDRTLID